MSKGLILFHALSYGLACMYAADNQYKAFFVYLIWGLLISFPILIKRLFMAAVIGFFATILCVCVPFLLPILPLLLIIPLLMKLSNIFKNLHWIVVGCVFYMLLLFGATPTSHWLYTSWHLSSTLTHALIFVLGAGLMGLIGNVAKTSGCEGSDFSFYVVGLPGFLISIFLPGDGDGDS